MQKLQKKGENMNEQIKIFREESLESFKESFDAWVDSSSEIYDHFEVISMSSLYNPSTHLSYKFLVVFRVK